MKYKEVDEKQARQCCRKHHKRTKKGIQAMCEQCPLRRTRTDKEGKIHVLFCWFVLKQMYDEIDEQMKELEQEEIQYEEEWKKFIERLETQE